MAATTLADCLVRLVPSYCYSLVYGSSATYDARSLVPDGRSRRKVWDALLEQGYLRLDKCAADEGLPVAIVTGKAFAEYVCDEDLHLGVIFRFDRNRHRDGKRLWVAFESLELPVRVRVLKLLLAGGGNGLRIGMSDSHGGVAEWSPLGKANEAEERLRQRLGRPHLSGDLVVSDDSVLAVYREQATRQLTMDYLDGGLDWFLRGRGVLSGEEKIPLSSSSTLGFHAQLPMDHTQWAAQLPDVIAHVNDEIARAQARLHLLERLKDEVEQVGGWDAFMLLYQEAIAQQVRARPIDEPRF